MSVDIGGDEGPIKSWLVQVIIDNLHVFRPVSELTPRDSRDFIQPNFVQPDIIEALVVAVQAYFNFFHYSLITLTNSVKLSELPVLIETPLQQSKSLRHLLDFILGEDRAIDQE
jgi:hypothetical protein